MVTLGIGTVFQRFLPRLVQIRGKPIAVVRARLQAFCGEAGFSRRHTYVLLGDGDALLLRDLLRRPRSWFKVLRSLRRGLPHVLSLALPGGSFRIKNNARLVYSDFRCPAVLRQYQLLSAKVALPSQLRSGSLSREIKARKLLGKINGDCPFFPTLIRYDQKRLYWLEEEFIPSDTAILSSDKANDFLKRYALNLYVPFSRSRRLVDSLKTFGFEYWHIEELFAEANAPLVADQRSATWPVSLIHGDLSPGNMIAAADGRLYIVDWEHFGRGPVAWDLRLLFRRGPKLVHDILQSVCRTDDIEPSLQMRVVFALELARLRRNPGAMIGYYEAHLGRSRSAALDALTKTEETLLSRMAG